MDRIWHKSYDPGVPSTREYPETCLPIVLEQNARLVPDSIATDFFGAKLNYRQLWDQVLRLANGLKRMDVGWERK
jgi:long-chain acyl-CoA synthetase